MIPISDARGVFTRQLIAVWNELSELKPKSFLNSFFEKKVTNTKEVSVQVRRGTELVAVDVLRGTNGNRNQITRHTEKLFVPPFYNEWFDATELDKYDLLFGTNVVDASVETVNSVIESAVEKLQVLRYKIERAYELQASNVFASGIVTLKSGDNIDFKRKAASMIDLSTLGYWNDPNVDPKLALQNAGIFLRNVGKAVDGEFNVIMGTNAFAMFSNSKFVTSQNYNIYIKLMELKMAQANAEGGYFHGQLSVGPYIYNIWTYPEIYEDSTLTAIPYVDPDHVYIIPLRSGKFTMAYAGVPAIIRDSRSDEFPQLISQTAADYVINNYIDPFQKKHVFEVLSAGLTVPVSIDRIYSFKATNGVAMGG
jgi:hypothetical protein